MFSDKSRYKNTPQIETQTADGRQVKAVAPRALPPTPGVPHEVKTNDRLDILAFRKLNDPLAFWRIADANTALDPFTLVDEAGDAINIPEP